MLRLTVELKHFPLWFFAKPRLVGFSRTLIVLFLSLETSIIFTLSLRCFTVFSDRQILHLEVHQSRQIFKCNNYTVTLIEQCVKAFSNTTFVPKRTLTTVSE